LFTAEYTPVEKIRISGESWRGDDFDAFEGDGNYGSVGDDPEFLTRALYD